VKSLHGRFPRGYQTDCDVPFVSGEAEAQRCISVNPALVDRLHAFGQSGTLVWVPDGEALPANAREELRKMITDYRLAADTGEPALECIRDRVADRLDAILSRPPVTADAPPVPADVVEGQTVEVKVEALSGVRVTTDCPTAIDLPFKILGPLFEGIRWFGYLTEKQAEGCGITGPGRYRLPILERLPDPPEPEPEKEAEDRDNPEVAFYPGRTMPDGRKVNDDSLWVGAETFRLNVLDVLDKITTRASHLNQKHGEGAQEALTVAVREALGRESHRPDPDPEPPRVRPWLLPQADEKFFPYICPECGGTTRERNDTPTLHSDSCSLRDVEWGEPRVLSAAETPAGATSDG